jgi:hypothetical protein
MTTSDDQFGIETSEEIVGAVTDDGEIVVENIVTTMDRDSGDLIVDDVVAVSHPDGSIEAEEIVSAISGKDGEEEILSDIVTSIDAKGHTSVTEIE